MEKRIKICALILLSLCLAVAPVMAVTYVPGGTYNAGTATYLDFDYYMSNAGGVVDVLLYVDGVNRGSISGDYGSTTLNLHWLVSLPSGKTQITVGLRVVTQQGSYTNSMIIYYNYGEPTPDPTPIPDGAYLTSTVISESNTAVTYQITPMPNDGTYSFSRVYTGSVSDNPAVYMSPVYSSEDAAINYILTRGTSQTFNCEYKKGYLGLPHTMSLTLSAPVYSEDEFINETIINNTLHNLPNPVKPSQTNPLSSGTWQAVGKDTVITSSFGNLVRNGGVAFALPHMASPEELRFSLLNGTDNLTAPLYDFIDSASGVVLFLPNLLSNAVGSVFLAVGDTVNILKDLLDSIFDLIGNCMDFFYILLPTVYLFIPDAVWWCFTAVLVFFIIKIHLIMKKTKTAVKHHQTASGINK